MKKVIYSINYLPKPEFTLFEGIKELRDCWPVAILPFGVGLCPVGPRAVWMSLPDLNEPTVFESLGGLLMAR